MIRKEQDKKVCVIKNKQPCESRWPQVHTFASSSCHSLKKYDCWADNNATYIKWNVDSGEKEGGNENLEMSMNIYLPKPTQCKLRLSTAHWYSSVSEVRLQCISLFVLPSPPLFYNCQRTYIWASDQNFCVYIEYNAQRCDFKVTDFFLKN